MKSCKVLRGIQDYIFIESVITDIVDQGYSFSIVHLIITNEYLITVGSVSHKGKNIQETLCRTACENVVVSKWNSWYYSQETKKAFELLKKKWGKS